MPRAGTPSAGLGGVGTRGAGGARAVCAERGCCSPALGACRWLLCTSLFAWDTHASPRTLIRGWCGGPRRAVGRRQGGRRALARLLHVHRWATPTASGARPIHRSMDVLQCARSAFMHNDLEALAAPPHPVLIRRGIVVGDELATVAETTTVMHRCRYLRARSGRGLVAGGGGVAGPSHMCGRRGSDRCAHPANEGRPCLPLGWASCPREDTSLELSRRGLGQNRLRWPAARPQPGGCAWAEARNLFLGRGGGGCLLGRPVLRPLCRRSLPALRLCRARRLSGDGLLRPSDEPILDVGGQRVCITSDRPWGRRYKMPLALVQHPVPRHECVQTSASPVHRGCLRELHSLHCSVLVAERLLTILVQLKAVDGLTVRRTRVGIRVLAPGVSAGCSTSTVDEGHGRLIRCQERPLPHAREVRGPDSRADPLAGHRTA